MNGRWGLIGPTCGAVGTSLMLPLRKTCFGFAIWASDNELANNNATPQPNGRNRPFLRMRNEFVRNH